MAFERPTLAALVARSQANIAGKLGLDVPVLTKSVARIFANALAGMSHMLHGHGAWIAKQIFSKTADIESLRTDAASYGFYENAATFASTTLVVSGTNGTTIDAGKEWSRPDGVIYYATASAIVASGTASVLLQARVAGAVGNAPAGTSLTLTSAIPGITSPTTSGVIEGGADAEEPEAFRARFLEFKATESLGGSDADFIGWAKAVSGVTRAWVYRHEDGLGTVKVRFVRDLESPIFPSAGEVADVQDALDAERPTTNEVTAAAPTAGTVNFTLSISPDTPEKRTAVEAELADLFYRLAEPGDGAGRGTIALSQMRTAVGVISPLYTLTVPSADYVPGIGVLPVVGAFTWV